MKTNDLAINVKHTKYQKINKQFDYERIVSYRL